MPVANPASLPWVRHLRLWLVTPVVHRLALLAGAALVAYGYGEIWAPVGSVEEVTRQVVGGMLMVVFGAALVGAATFWHD